MPVHRVSGRTPGVEHRRGLPAADVLGGRRSDELNPGGHVARVAVGERVDHVLGGGHVAGLADRRFDDSLGRALVIAAVVLEVLVIDGAVVGERREDADRKLAGDRSRCAGSGGGDALTRIVSRTRRYWSTRRTFTVGSMVSA